MGERIVLLFIRATEIIIAGTPKVGLYQAVVLDYTYCTLSSLTESIFFMYVYMTLTCHSQRVS